MAGGTSVTIIGTGFTDATAVKFGSGNALMFMVNSDTQITCMAPAGAVSTVDVTVTTAQGTSATVSADHYTYTMPVVAGAVTATVSHGTSNNHITLNLSGGVPASVAVATAPSHGTATASNTTITYTPTASYSGSDSFTYTATNAAGTLSPATVSVTVSAPTLVISPSSGTALTGTTITPYSQTFSASGGTAPYSYTLAVHAGTMQSGLAFNAGTGVLSGTPTTSGVFGFTVSATDSSTGTGPFSVTGSYPLTVLDLPVGTLSFSTPTSASVTLGGSLTNAASSTLSGGSYGTISYGSSNTSVATVNANGVVTPVSVGSAVITATQAAVVGVNAQASQSYTLTVGAGSSIVVLTSSPSAPMLGQAVTLTATITPSTATGTVNFFDSGATLGHSSVSGGRATLVISSLTAGAHPLTAAYSGDGSTAAATSAVTTVAVGQHDDPTTNAMVKQSVSTQVATVQRFSQTQLTNIHSHVRLLHNDFAIANRLDMEINAKGVDTLRTLGNALYASYANGGQSQPLVGGNALYASYANGGQSQPQVGGNALKVARAGFTPGAGRAPAVQSEAASGPRMDSDGLRIVGMPVGVWSAGSVQIGSTGNGNGGHTNFSSSGVTMGMDMQWNNNLIAGLSVGYAQGTTTMDALGSESKSKMWSGSLYATYRPAHKWFVDALLGGGSMGYDNHRWDDINSTLLSGDRRGLSFYGSVSLTREFEALDFRLHPFGRFDASETLLDQYSEHGSSAALTYKDSSFITTSFTGGLEVFKDISLDSGQLSPSAKVQLAHRTSGDVKQDVFYTDMGAGSSNYSMLVGSGTPEDMQSFGLGLNFKNRYGLQTNLSWLSSFGTNEYRSNSFKLDVRMGF